MKRSLVLALALVGLSVPSVSKAAVKYIVVDPATRLPVAAELDIYEGTRLVGTLATTTNPTEKPGAAPAVVAPLVTGLGPVIDGSQQVVLVMGSYNRFLVAGGGGPAAQVTSKDAQDGGQGAPVKEITIVVRAPRRAAPKPPAGTSGSTRDRSDIQKFSNTTSGDTKALVRGQSGVASDSAGQTHVRGEHADIAYVVDGVLLPDTLAGSQGSVVVPSTIERLSILTGGFAPEFGGQTAAILDITTIPGAKTFKGEAAFQGGSFSTYNGNLTLQGPLSSRASFVFNVGSSTAQAAIEPHQPDVQDAHNAASSHSYFADFRFHPNANDAFTLTMSQNPNALQISNRTGLPASFAPYGQGFGFLGLRNADGSRPDVNSSTAGSLGSQNILLPSQQADGQNISQDEVSEFATLDYHRRFNDLTKAQFALTALHSGQDLYNTNPTVDVTNLPIDNSIEYNPTVSRNVHHTQGVGSLETKAGRHSLKTGFLYDYQTGNESYNIIPASQLALDELAVLAPNLSPAGIVTGMKDVNGNPVYRATGPSPTLNVHRRGYYGASYAQDTWRLGRFTANYGLRADWYQQAQDTGQPTVNDFALSPRINLAYQLNQATETRGSYNRLLNVPPLAQGAVVGQPVQPEKINQYDLGVTHGLGHGNSVEAAYYYKDIRNQVDTGLLVPGADIGLYSAVNFQRGAVHGIELSYELSPPSGKGFDGFVNYSYSVAQPEGVDNTGAPVPLYNDHDQRHTVGSGLAYTWLGGPTAALTFQYGSGLASSVVNPLGGRVARYEVDFHFSSGELFFGKRLALTLDVQNLTDQRTVINFDSAFSGTRFMEGRRLLLGMDAKF